MPLLADVTDVTDVTAVLTRCPCWPEQDEFLRSLGGTLSAADAPPLVVLAMAPGQIVAPWASHADAALAMFLAGEQTGNAWA